MNRFSTRFHPLPGVAEPLLYIRPHDMDILHSYLGEKGVSARVEHVFSTGNFTRVALTRLAKLAIAPGAEVWVVFRHIRLFPEHGRFTERDIVA